MLPVSAQDSADVDSVSGASSSAKTVHSPTTQRKGSVDNETSATKVFVRVRPFSAAERRQSGSGDPPAIVAVSEDNPCHITTLDPSKKYLPKSTYVFDRCFNSAAIKPAAGADAQVLLPDGKDGSAGVSLSTLEDVAAEALLNPLQLDCLARDQAAVYGFVGRPVLMNALAGYNGCVFAYGQTGSGKTYTMMGPPGTFGAVVTSAGAASPLTSSKKFRRAATGYAGSTAQQQRGGHDTSSLDDAGDSRFQSYSSMTPRTNTTALRTPRLVDPLSPPDTDLTTPRGDKTPKMSTKTVGGAGAGGVEGDEGLQGIVPRLVRDLFDELHLKRERDSSHSFRVEVEYYEIYREKVMDLLSSHSASTNTELRVRQSKTSGPYVENLKKKHVEDERQVFRLLRQGNLRRHTASTAMNDRSSRSHAIFVLHLVQMHIADHDSSSAKVSSKVNLVDLAGSEKTGAHNAEGDQFKEGVVINISLTVLGRVIDALADKSQGKRNVFCPYRDSVLTWLLMDSLGGNSKTTMVATVSPHCVNFEEACQTLRYASRAKQIVTKVVVNEDPQVRQIKLLTAEVQRLKALLVAEGKVAENTDEDVEALQDRIHALEAELNDTRTELEAKSAELSNLQALRRITSSVPSTLKAGNAGPAGTAKELSKAKSDVRRLEAENLLHLQTEEELHRSLERVRALEARYTQLLGDLRDAQESTRRLEKDKQERDRRIIDLQQQLFQERARAEAMAEENARTVSPGGASAHSSATPSTTVLTPTASIATPTAGAASAATPTNVSTTFSPAEKPATRKSVVLKKGGKKTKTGAAAEADATEADWEAARAELCAQFDEEKKLLNLQVQDRTDAFRKSQLDVKKLKAELKSSQETLQVLEKRLNDHHADAVRRLQEEVQEVRRTLKEERKGNKDIRQLMAGPPEERPTFSLLYVVDALVAHEQAERESVAEEESIARALAAQAIELSRAEAEKATRVAAAHATAIAAAQAEATEHAQARSELQSEHAALLAAHTTLTAADADKSATIARLQAQLAELVAAQASEAEAQRDAVRQLEEQVDALRELTAEKEEDAAEQAKQQAALTEKVATLQTQLEAAQERREALVADHVRQLKERELAFTAATTAAAAREAAHAEQQASLTAAHEMELAKLNTTIQEVESQLHHTQQELQREREAHCAEAERGAVETQRHANALADKEAQLDTAVQAASEAEERHAAQRAALEEQLAQQQSDMAALTATVEKQLAELQQRLDARVAESESTERELSAQLMELRASVARSEAARQALVERSLEQAAAYEEQLRAVQEEVAAEKRAKSVAEDENAMALQKITAELLNQQQQSNEARSALSSQIADLESQLAKANETRLTEAKRSADEKAVWQAEAEALREDLRAEKASKEACIVQHAKELQNTRAESARSEAAANAKAQQLSEQLRALQAEMETATSQHEERVAELTQQLEHSKSELQRSEDARKHQIERALEQSAAHAKAVEGVQAELAAEKANALNANTEHEKRVRELEDALHSQQKEATQTAASLQQQLEALQATLQQERDHGSQTAAALQATVGEVREELRKSEEARKAHIQRSLEQSAEHAQSIEDLNAKVMAVNQSAEDAQKAHAEQVAALSAELRAKVKDAAEQVRDLQAQLKAHEESAKLQAAEKDSQLATLQSTLTATQAELTTSENARKAVIEKSNHDAREQNEALAALRLQLAETQQEAAAAAVLQSKQLQEVERQLEHKTATADATAAALHKELKIQRQTAAAQAVQHARTTKDLEDQLEAAQRATQAAVDARKEGEARAAAQAAEHAETVKGLQAQLAEAAQTSTASAVAHEAAVQRMRSDQTKSEAEMAAAMQTVQKELQLTQAALARAEQARDELAEEGMQQAEVHTKSLESLQRMLEANHKQQVTTMKKSHADYVASLEAQMTSQKTAAQALRDDLADARSQIKQMVETQNYLGKQLEREKEGAAALRERADSTEKARAASAAEAVQLQAELRATTAKVEQQAKEAAQLSQQLLQAQAAAEGLKEELATQRGSVTELERRAEQHAAALRAAETAVENLTKEVSGLQAEKTSLLTAQQALVEKQRQELVAQEVDTVTELEAQFRAMEKERRAEQAEARQMEHTLRATIEKQAQDLQQMRDDLDFHMSMTHLESGQAHRGSVAGSMTPQTIGLSSAATINGGGGGGSAGNNNINSAATMPISGGGMAANRTLPNGSFASRSNSPVPGSSVTSGVAGMLSSFFRRTNAGAMPAPTTSTAALGSNTANAPMVQRHSSALRTRIGGGLGSGVSGGASAGLNAESRTGATTPVRRGSNFYTTSSYRPSAAASFFHKAEATNSSPAVGAGLNGRSGSTASLDNYVVEPESTSWHTPASSHAPNTLLPPE